MKIFKYTLNPFKEHQVVKVPPLSTVLKVGRHQDELHAWVRVDDTLEPTEDMDLWVLGTGQDLECLKSDAHYVDTVFDGPYVWHVFSGHCYD